MDKYKSSPTWQKAVMTIGFFLWLGTMVAQSPPPPPPGQVLLIPYNDQGTWGYCDTLGNMVIDPTYQEASFFFRNSVGGEIIQAGKVVTKWGENRILESGNLLLPKKLNYLEGFYVDRKSTNTFLISKKGKYGIYDLNEGMILPAKYDSLINDFPWILLKRKKEAAYRRYNPATQQLETTEYLSLTSYLRGYNTVMIATTAGGEHYELKDGELQLISPETLATYDTEDDMLVEMADEDWERNDPHAWQGPKASAADLGVDRILEYKDYRSLGRGDKYGFERIYIAEKDGQSGILNEKGAIILPFRYDRLTLTNSATQVVLEKDGKVGRKLLFSHHPTIEPRYDRLRERARLRVNPHWVFAVYEVVLNGQKGYVGENAVEYFRWE